MIEDDHLLADLPLVVLHVVPVEDGQGDHQGGRDGQHGHQHRADVSRDETKIKMSKIYPVFTFKTKNIARFTYSAVRYDDLQDLAFSWFLLRAQAAAADKLTCQ